MVSFAFTAPTAVERVPESSVVQGEQDEVLVRLAARMKANIATGDRRRHLFKKYADCFTGMEAVDWMLEQMEAKSIAEAVRKGQGLLTSHYIEKVEKELKFEYNKKRFYRFTPTTPEFVSAHSGPDRPLPSASLDLPLSAASRKRALAAILGGFVADAASTSLNGVSHPEKTIPNLLRLDFDPAFCGLYDSAGGEGGKSGKGGKTRMESSTGFEARMILQCVARRGHLHGSQLAKDAYWAYKNDHRLLSTTSRAFIKRIHAGKSWPNCAVKCRSIDVIALIPVVVALYAGTNSLFTKVDELVKVFYSGQRVRDAALVAAFILEQVILGASVLQAMRMSIRTERLTVKQRKMIFKAFTKSQLPSYEAIQKFGNKGSLPRGFFAVLQPLFVLSDYPTAVRENIIGGGRTCRRAMFIGACFAAQDGLESLPEGWIKKTQYYDLIEADAKALISQREVQSGFSTTQEEEVDVAPRSSLSASYTDYSSRASHSGAVPPRSSLRASLSGTHRSSVPSGRSSLSQSHSIPSVATQHQPYQHPRPGSHLSNQSGQSGGYRPRSGSFESASSSPRSVASNFSYASGTTTGSSVRSVIDLGDMDMFYQQGGGSYGGSSTPRDSDKRLSFEMHKFFQQYGHNSGGSGRLSIGENDSFAHSNTSTLRASDMSMNPLRASDLNPFFQSTRSSGGPRRHSERNMFSQSGYSVNGGNNGHNGMARASDGNLFYQSGAFPQASRASSVRASDPHPFYQHQPTSYESDQDDDDVVLAHRVSLDQDQRVSIHAIL
ncbi:Crystallin j1a-like [Globisporangium polare]